jgi:hypothetical protein
MKSRYNNIVSLAVAAVIAAALFGCSSPALEEEAPQYDDQGRRLVTFSVPTKTYDAALSGVRALSEDSVKTAWDYVQVVLNYKGADGNGDPDTVWGDDNDEYYVDYADKGDEIRFSIPEGEYRGLMFLGTARDLQLLAVGVATRIRKADGSDAGTVVDGVFPMTAAVRTIEFTVEPLTSNIKQGAFVLEGPTMPVDYSGDAPVGEYTPASSINGLTSEAYPYFNVPSSVQAAYSVIDGTAIKGTFTFKGFPAIVAPAVGIDLSGGSLPTDAWLGLANELTDMMQIIGIAAHNSKEKLDLPPITVEGQVEAAKLESGALKLAFGLQTPDTPGLKDGYVKAQFNPAVQAFGYGGGTTPKGDKGRIWRIANGFDAGALDAGGVSLGQNILLLVGDKTAGDNFDVIGEISSEPPPPPLMAYYVGNGGNDAYTGLTRDDPLANIATAYNKAVASSDIKTIIVIGDRSTSGTWTFSQSVATAGTITVRGDDVVASGLARSSGTDAQVITVSAGADIVFENLWIKGNYSGSVYNRALHVTGAGTRVTLGNGAKIYGKVAGAGLNGGAILVDTNGALIMSGGEIISSSAAGAGGGVYVESGGTFTMTGGKISGNTAPTHGGGVSVNAGKFALNGGEISGNNTGAGGGVYVESGTFTMYNGKISGNTSSGYGAGVNISDSASSFIMTGGEISGNTASGGSAPYGGGVYVGSGTFTLGGGAIRGNRATSGGGIRFGNGTFIMTGGEISGNGDALTTKGGGVRFSGYGLLVMSGGVVYGSNAVGSLKNTADEGAAFNVDAAIVSDILGIVDGTVDKR